MPGYQCFVKDYQGLLHAWWAVFAIARRRDVGPLSLEEWGHSVARTHSDISPLLVIVLRIVLRCRNVAGETRHSRHSYIHVRIRIPVGLF